MLKVGKSSAMGIPTKETFNLANFPDTVYTASTMADSTTANGLQAKSTVKESF